MIDSLFTRATILCAFAAACALAAGSADAQIHVPADQPTLAAAIAAASPGEEIILANGVWSGPGFRDLDPGGKNLVVRSAGGPGTCTIDLQNAGRLIRYRSGEDTSSVLQGFTIVNGQTFFDGGAVLVEDSGVTIRNCLIRECEGVFGGALAVYGNSTVVVRDSSFELNEGILEGGAIYVFGPGATLEMHGTNVSANAAFDSGALRAVSATLIIEWCAFAANFGGQSFGNGFGGAIRTTGVTGSVRETHFVDNISVREGGALYLHSTNMTFTDCFFQGNMVDGSFNGEGNGGACRFRNDSEIHMLRCVFVDNRVDAPATARGGAIYMFDGQGSTFTRCEFIGNYVIASDPGASTRGGAVDTPGTGTPIFRDCLFEGNFTSNPASSNFGGGVSVVTSTGEPSFINCEFRNNFSQFGGGMYIQGFTTNRTTALIEDCVFEDNTAETNGGGLRILTNRETTIRSTVFRNNRSNDDGGGVYIANATVDTFFINCRFEGNTAADDGAGITLAVGSRTQMIDCDFINNVGDATLDGTSSGGAIRVRNNSSTVPTELSLLRCRFIGNVATNGFGGAIGAISAQAGESIVLASDCHFEDNRAGFGGGVHHQGFEDAFFVPTPSVGRYESCGFQSNQAGSSGGAVRALIAAEVELVNSRVIGNTSGGSGAGAYVNGSTLTAVATLFSGNGSSSSGGGIANDVGGITRAVNCIFTNNSAVFFGGAGSVTGGQAFFDLCTISGNSATSGGNALAVRNPNAISGVELTVRNSILWTNPSPGTPSEIAAQDAVTLSVAYSNLRGGRSLVEANLDPAATLNWGLGNICRDPKFVDPGAGDFRLGRGSFAVDAGSSSLIPPQAGGVDFAGNPRQIDAVNYIDSGEGFPVVDMGALEAPADLVGGCMADLTGTSNPNDPNVGVADGQVDANDFFYFLDQFAAGSLCAVDFTTSSDPNNPNYGKPDGQVDASDFFFFLDRFIEGCI